MITILRQRALKHFHKKRLLLKPKKSLDTHFGYYFAYGANLNISRFHKFNIQAEEVGPACLKNHVLKYNLPCEYKNKGYAGVERLDNSEVWGVLFKVETSGLKLLDILEWVPFNFYTREKGTITCGAKEYSNVNYYKTKYPQDGLMAPQVIITSFLQNQHLETFQSHI